MSFYNFAKGVCYGILRCMFRITVEGAENIPKDENFIICANHKSNFDAPLIAVCLPIQVSFMAKAELFAFKPFGRLLAKLGAFPVKRGKSDIGAFKTAVNLVKDNKFLAIFPEGKRCKGENLGEGKSGAAMIAVKAGANILPIGIDGRYIPFSKITVRVGEPIDLSEFWGQKTSSELLGEITSKRLMPKISQLSGVKVYGDTDCR